jgi:hypothetical protein
MTYQNNISSSKEDELEVDLINWNPNGKLGFSITGGVGSQHIRGDDGIYVKYIQEGGLISWDGRIWVGDQLVAVKQELDGARISLDNCTHEHAVSILRNVCSAKRVVLIVRKSEVNLVNWNKNDQLGFSISGGTDKQHIPGDNRVYITSIVEGGNAFKDGRLSVGDRLLAVKRNVKSNSMRYEDFFLMEKCTHKEAVSILQECRKGKQVILVVCKKRNIPRRLRFDDTPLEQPTDGNVITFNTQAFASGQQLLPRITLLPNAQFSNQENRPGIKSILKQAKTSKGNKSNEEIDRECKNRKIPIRIKYVSGEPISQEDLTVITIPPKVTSKDHQDSCNRVISVVEDHCTNNADDNLNSSGSSSSSSMSMHYVDSALSSMSSEDESHFLDFSNVAAELSQVHKPKMSHIRHNSQHLIEPMVTKSNSPVTQFSRPPLDKDRMFSSPSALNGGLSDNMVYKDRQVVHEKTSSDSHKNKEISHFPKDVEKMLRNEYFNKRYNIPSSIFNDQIFGDQHDFNHRAKDISYNSNANTNHFVKVTRHYDL